MLQWVSTEVIVKNKEIEFFSMKSAIKCQKREKETEKRGHMFERFIVC